MTGGPILSVRRLTVDHPLSGAWPWASGGRLRAVDDLHFNLHRGEALGIVGESGCGKSTLARALVGLQPITTGGIVLDGRDLARSDAAQWAPYRRRIQMVFQDPFGSLDPRLTIHESVAEPLTALCPELDALTRARRIAELLERVGINDVASRYPHELSGGQCQRAGIARALVVEPDVLICDEPLSALDVRTQAQVLQLLEELQRERGLALLLISHDLGVVRRVCQRVLVMYLGRIMEQAPAPALFAQPRHPYTRALIASAPRAEPRKAGFGARVPLAGEMPSPVEPPSGCVFRTRCPMADDLCAREVPYLRRVSSQAHAACHYLQEADEPLTAGRREGVVGRARPMRSPGTPV